jgi:hypothetical protein
MAAKRGGRKPGRVVSKAQQGFLFATKKPFAKRWSMAAGEVGPHGKPSAASKAAYKRLPARKGARKRG